VDPVEQLWLLLQAVPVANAVVPPALVYQAPPAVAQVHQVPAPPPNVPQLNLSAAANNANAAPPWWSLLFKRTLAEITLQIISCPFTKKYCRKEQFQSRYIPIRPMQLQLLPLSKSHKYWNSDIIVIKFVSKLNATVLKCVCHPVWKTEDRLVKYVTCFARQMLPWSDVSLPWSDVSLVRCNAFLMMTKNDLV
jgi:hypothetical protein